LFPGVTISEDDEGKYQVKSRDYSEATSCNPPTKYKINGTKGKVDTAINMLRFFSSTPDKIFGICYRLHPILYETEERLEELVMMSAKITTHSADKIFILGSSEAEGFKYLFVHGLADSGNQYKLQRYINAQVEKLEAEAREEGSKPAPQPASVSVNRQNTVSDTIRYSKEELLKVRTSITEPLPALAECKLAIVRIHGVHARDTTRYGSSEERKSSYPREEERKSSYEERKSSKPVHSRLGPVEDRKHPTITKDSLQDRLGPPKTEQKLRSEDISSSEQKPRSEEISRIRSEYTSDVTSSEEKEEEKSSKPGITRITWP